MKFGGTSVGEADCIQRVADIIEPHHAAGDEVALVVSACSGVTDQIIAMADEAETRKAPGREFLQRCGSATSGSWKQRPGPHP